MAASSFLMGFLHFFVFSRLLVENFFLFGSYGCCHLINGFFAHNFVLWLLINFPTFPTLSLCTASGSWLVSLSRLHVKQLF